MKISKIFHWLYASVMLMPIFAIGVKCLYAMINQNAKESYYGETINETQSYLVTQVEPNNQYELIKPQNELIHITSNSFRCELTYFNCSRTEVQTWVDARFDTIKGLNFIYTGTQYRIIFLNENNTQIDYWSFSQGDSWDIKFIALSVADFVNDTNNLYRIEYNDYSYLDNVFYYAVDQVNNEPLFSWAQSSFLSQPLLFITNFFGVPSTSPILTILCYWFSISVIWLVFDAVMYFPLLIHRWLDKGVLE